MEIVPVTSPLFWNALFRAELMLTVNIVAGLVTGEIILSLGIVDMLFAPLVPILSRWGIHKTIAGAMFVALGSSRSGAAMISACFVSGGMSREEAVYGTLSLAFPGYLRRWVGTAALAWGLAGIAGLIYAIILLARSALRFVWVVFLLTKRRPTMTTDASPPEKSGAAEADKTPQSRRRKLAGIMCRSLPWAWFFFAVAYAAMPFVERAFEKHAVLWGFGSFLPPEGWAVAVSALAHVMAALSSARAALAAGDLAIPQAVLALLVGNMVGTLTRTMRQNVGYWMGIFPRELIPSLLRWHLVTMFSLEIATILIVWSVSGVMMNG
ncbi:MAG: hypothetical protein LBS45_01035 [Synergistaceae bacterium]|jgi:hypothetical protein|nr:hypothetical protein [Synergistaceae bacterium]